MYPPEKGVRNPPSGNESPTHVLSAAIDGLRSLPFCYGDGIYHPDEELECHLRACSAFCRHSDGQVPGFHAECMAVASPPSRAFLAATEYSFEPAPSDDTRRYDRTRRLLAIKCYDTYGKLPLELWWMVAAELVHECIMYTTHKVFESRSSSNCEVDISLGVWARYIHIDGVRYIADLSNEADPSKRTMLLNACEASEVDVLYSLEDHLGIRQLVFSCQGGRVKLLSSPSKSRKGALWWRTLGLGSRKLAAMSDVSVRQWPHGFPSS